MRQSLGANRSHSTDTFNRTGLGSTYCASNLRQLKTMQLKSATQARSRLNVNAVAGTAAPSTSVPALKTAGENRKPKLACRLITAIKTPYLYNGKFDFPAYDQMVYNQIENGVEGLIIGGTTGEGQLMSWDEHIMLIAHTKNTFGANIKVIGNTGSNSTREALHATEQGFNVGMDAALQINPYYGKTSHEGLMAHFRALLAEGPAIIYNVPGRTGQDIPNEVMEQLAREFPREFLGVKECTGNERIRGYASQGITCWSGNDDEAHAARHEYGGHGVISVTSNLIPGLYAHLMREPDFALMDDLQELVAWLFSEPNPIPLNTALMMCGMIKPVFRLPYVPLSKESRELGCRLLQKVAEHIPGAGQIRAMEDKEFIKLSKY